MSKKIVRHETDEAWRSELALNASWEADALLRMLDKVKGNDSFDLVWRGTYMRLLELTSVCMSVLGTDDNRETQDMADVIYGEDGWLIAEEATEAANG